MSSAVVEFKICNMTSGGTMGYCIDVEMLRSDFPQTGNYNNVTRAAFKASRIENCNLPLTFIVFKTGRFFITQGRTQRTMREGHRVLTELLRQYRVDA